MYGIYMFGRVDVLSLRFLVQGLRFGLVVLEPQTV